MNPLTLELSRPDGNLYTWRLLAPDGTELLAGQKHHDKKELMRRFARAWPDYTFNWRAGEALLTGTCHIRMRLNDLT